MSTTLRRAGLAAALALAVAAPAASAETFKATFGPTRENVFNWEGMASGAPTIPMVLSNGCFDFEPMFRCDLIVFKMEADGTLEAGVEVEGALTDPTGAYAYPDVKIALYASNAAGVHPDDADPIAESDTGGPEAVKADVKAGNYVLEVEAVQGQDIAYKGTSKGSNFPAAAPSPSPGQPEQPGQPGQPEQPGQPGQPAQPESKPTRTGKRAACQKKAKKKYKRNAKKRKAALKRCKKQPQ